VQELLNQIDAEVHDEGKRRQVRDSEEMLEKVQKAIQLLEGRQELVTYQSVSQIVGIPSQRFAYYPQAQTLLKRHAQYQNQMTQRVRLREDEIVAGVQRAIQQLEENQQRVTMNAVCRIVGISPSCFTTYPCIKALLDQRADHRSRIQLEKAIQRENELFLHVEEAIRELRSLNRQVTQKAIAALVGMQPNSMKQYPRVRSVLAENAGVYHHNTRTHSQEREGELVARVAAAKDLLESSGQVVTQRAIARMVGLGPRSFMRYPKVRMLIPPQKNISRLRSVQASPAEDKLIFDVEKAMQQLDAQGLTVTMPRVSASLGISPMMLLRYPRVLSSVKEVAKDQARKRYEQREDELVQTAYTTIQRLRELGHPINFTAVAKAMQRSASSLRYYPKIRSLVEQIRRENEPCI